MEISAEEMPEGWTNDPAMLRLYSHLEGSINTIAEWHRLGDIELLMMGTQSSGNMQFIIQSGCCYYWGNLMIDDIFEIRKPRTFPEILHALATKGHFGLKYKKVERIPEGWTNDPAILRRYSRRGSSINRIAQKHGLRNIQVLLMGTPESEDVQYIIKSGRGHYWGNLMTDDIFEITKPKTFLAILHTLYRRGDWALTYKKVEQVEEV